MILLRVLNALAIATLLLPVFTGMGGARAAEQTLPPGLLDQNGQPFGPSALKGRFAMIYFGYTNCPDICPTTLFEMGAALDLLGSDARTKVQPIFVTVDPDRDTPPSIKAYLEPLGHGFIGVTGSTAAVDAYAWDHQVVVMRSIGEGQTYTVDHTSSVLLLAPDGSVAERFPYEMDYREVARRMGERIVGSPLAREGASAR